MEKKTYYGIDKNGRLEVFYDDTFFKGQDHLKCAEWFLFTHRNSYGPDHGYRITTDKNEIPNFEEQLARVTKKWEEYFERERQAAIKLEELKSRPRTLPSKKELKVAMKKIYHHCLEGRDSDPLDAIKEVMEALGLPEGKTPFYVIYNIPEDGDNMYIHFSFKPFTAEQASASWKNEFGRDAEE